jgi:signal peptidase I
MPTQSAEPNYYLGEKKESLFKKIIRITFKSGFNAIQGFVILMTLLVFVYLFVLSPHIIDGRSMQPNFCNGDVYFTFKLSGLFGGYKRDEVITFKHDEANDYIKRVIGLPGDSIRVEGGRVYRNGELLDEKYIPEGRETLFNPGDELSEGMEYIVPEGTYFVLGDNRPHSTDSRHFLAIDPLGANPIDGKVVLVLWPLQRARIFDHQSVKPELECKGTFAGEE